MNLFLTFFGYRKLYADEKNATALLNACLLLGISYVKFQCDADGSIRFCCRGADARRLLAHCAKSGVRLRVLRGGFPHFLWRYRRRAGMMIGLLIGVVLLWLSGRFVWDVRVTGNETMRTDEVRRVLRDCGFGVGSYIPNFRGEELETRVMLHSDRISWISVYMDGTVARVQIKENHLPPPKESTKPANLVAAYDGQIELLQLYRGNCVVKIGQAVKAGELLVSGVYDSQTQGYRLTRAAGSVLARVDQDFCIMIPLSYEKKIYEDEKVCEIMLDFFDFSLKIFKNSRNAEGDCDIIEEEKGLELFGICNLPIGYSVKRAYAYRTQTESRTAEEALRLAYEQLDRELAVFSDGAELLEKNIKTTLTEDALILNCTVKCIKDIAVQVEFDVVP